MAAATTRRRHIDFRLNGHSGYRGRRRRPRKQRLVVAQATTITSASADASRVRVVIIVILRPVPSSGSWADSRPTATQAKRA